MKREFLMNIEDFTLKGPCRLLAVGADDDRVGPHWGPLAHQELNGPLLLDYEDLLHYLFHVPLRHNPSVLVEAASSLRNEISTFSTTFPH